MPLADLPMHLDGVYFGLAEDPYHADPALGSSDVKRLRTSGPDYWWGSVLNPNRPVREDKAHHTFGRAVHKLVLEGVEAFHALYQRDEDGADVLRTADDLSRWLKAHGAEKVGRSKAAMIEEIGQRVALLASAGKPVAPPPIADVIDAEATKAGRTILKTTDFDRIVGAAAAIASNEGLATAFQNGQPEVSVFWTAEIDGFPVRCKARFDYLKLGGVGDLKSIRNSRGIDFVEAVRRAVAEYRYDIQAAHYLTARRMLPDLVRGGAVFGASSEVLAWIERVAAREAFGFQWVFYQAEGAPNVKSYTLSPENPIAALYGQQDVDTALRTYAAFARTHAPGEAWRLASQVEELDPSDLPAWFGRA